MISIIIPLYNAEATLRETLESVFCQTFTDFEVIVVNDGSTDGSLDVLTELADPRLRVLSFPNGGAAIARNRGLQEAQGEYVAFLDADDLWLPEKLMQQWQTLDANPGAAVAHSWTQFIDEQGKPLSWGNRTVVQGNAYAKLLVNNFLDSGSNPLIRRSALLAIGGFDPLLTSSQDWDLYLRLAARFPFVTVPAYHVQYRLRSGSISSHIARQEQQALSFINRAYEDAPPDLQPLRSKTLAHLYRYLTLRGLECPPSAYQSWAIARCWLLALRYNPALVRQQTRLMLVLAAKIGLKLLGELRLRVFLGMTHAS